MKLGLLFGIAPQRVRTKIYFLTFAVRPKDMVSIFLELDFFKVPWLLKPSENSSPCDERP